MSVSKEATLIAESIQIKCAQDRHTPLGSGVIPCRFCVAEALDAFAAKAVAAEREAIAVRLEELASRPNTWAEFTALDRAADDVRARGKDVENENA